MEEFRKKKSFGQHFLKDKQLASKISLSLNLLGKDYYQLIEIGPGDGSLTEFLTKLSLNSLFLIEVDTELINHLKKKFPELKERILNQDFLKIDLKTLFSDQFGVIGNFPYNISSQILIKVIENRVQIPEMVGMFQKEVAERVCSKPGNKVYGRISVMVQAFYQTELIYKVSPEVFSPPPKVESAVIRLTRKNPHELDCNEKMFFNVVKDAFNQRRKTLRNSLKSYQTRFDLLDADLLGRRAETLSVEEFVMIAKVFQNQ